MRRVGLICIIFAACYFYCLPCYAIYWADFVYGYYDLNGNGLFNGGIDYNGNQRIDGNDKLFTDSVSPSVALGEPDSTYVSIQQNEYIIFGFNRTFVNGPGDDICVVETGPSGETADVLVSDDGSNFYLVGQVNVNTSGTPTGQYGERYWLDLGSLMGPFKYVKIISKSNAGGSPGFDLSGVGVVNTSSVPLPATFWLLSSGLAMALRFRRKSGN